MSTLGGALQGGGLGLTTLGRTLQGRGLALSALGGGALSSISQLTHLGAAAHLPGTAAEDAARLALEKEELAMQRFGVDEEEAPIDITKLPSVGRMRTPSPYMMYGLGSGRAFELKSGMRLANAGPKPAPRPTMRMNSRKKGDPEHENEKFFDEDDLDEEALEEADDEVGDMVPSFSMRQRSMNQRMRTPSPCYEYMPA